MKIIPQKPSHRRKEIIRGKFLEDQFNPKKNMEQVTAFKASDGTLFNTSNECQTHDISMVWRGRINDFLESEINSYPAKGNFTANRKVLIAWEQFKSGAISESDADPI